MLELLSWCGEADVMCRRVSNPSLGHIDRFNNTVKLVNCLCLRYICYESSLRAGLRTLRSCCYASPFASMLTCSGYGRQDLSIVWCSLSTSHRESGSDVVCVIAWLGKYVWLWPEVQWWGTRITFFAGTWKRLRRASSTKLTSISNTSV